MKRLDSKCGCLLISSNRKLCNFFYVRGRRNIAFDVLSVVLMLLFALPLLRKCKWRPGPESKEIKSRLSTQLVTAFTIQLSDVPRKLSDEVTENIYSPLTRLPPARQFHAPHSYRIIIMRWSIYCFYTDIGIGVSWSPINQK